MNNKNCNKCKTKNNCNKKTKDGNIAKICEEFLVEINEKDENEYKVTLIIETKYLGTTILTLEKVTAIKNIDEIKLLSDGE